MNDFFEQTTNCFIRRLEDYNLNILQISPYLPSTNANHAGGVCMGKEIEALNNCNNTVYVLTFVSTKHEVDLLEKNKATNAKIEYVKINKIQRLLHIILNPLKPNYFATRSSIRFSIKLIRLIKDYNINAIHAEYTSMGQYLWIKKIYPSLKFNLVQHDVTLQSFRRKVICEKSLIKRWYYYLQERLIFLSEKKYCSVSDNIFVFNKKDKCLIQNEYHVDNVTILSPYYGIEKEVIKHNIWGISTNKENNICFMGQMGRPENYLAAYRLIRIFNNISDQIHNCKLFIIGNNPPEKLKSMASDRINITGYVDDVDDYMKKCKIAVFPLTLGAGIKIKVLRSMVSGIPVITTNIGAEGIDESGKVLLICQSDKEFETNIINLLNNVDVYENYKRAQYEFINESFNWEKSVDILNKHYASLVDI